MKGHGVSEKDLQYIASKMPAHIVGFLVSIVQADADRQKELGNELIYKNTKKLLYDIAKQYYIKG